MSKFIPHQSLIRNIRTLIEDAKKQVVRNVNTTMLITYFEIGRMIVEYEQKGRHRAEYAKETLKTLSRALNDEFGKGYSVDNLQLMRKFFITYTKSDTLSRISQKSSGLSIYETVSRKSQIPFQLSWSHYVQLLKIEEDKERNFYEIEAVQNN